MEEYTSATEKIDHGGFANDFATGLVEDIKQKLVEVDKHITKDMDPKNFEEDTSDDRSLVQKSSSATTNLDSTK